MPQPGAGGRRGPWRPLAFAGIVAFIVGLSFVVGRARLGRDGAAPYAGVRGASRKWTAGLAVTYQRGAEVSALKPGTPVRAGDVLRFVVRGERPRHLVLRARDGGGPLRTLFPAGGAPLAQVVRPGEPVPAVVEVAPGAGKVVLTALFADAPFPVGAPPAPETEVVEIVMEKAAE